MMVVSIIQNVFCLFVVMYWFLCYLFIHSFSQFRKGFCVHLDCKLCGNGTEVFCLVRSPYRVGWEGVWVSLWGQAGWTPPISHPIAGAIFNWHGVCTSKSGLLPKNATGKKTVWKHPPNVYMVKASFLYLFFISSKPLFKFPVTSSLAFQQETCLCIFKPLALGAVWEEQ